MTRVVIDKALLAKLAGLHGPIEFCDDAGATVGYYSPVHRHAHHFDWGISDEELRRREQGRTGRPVEEVLADWENRR